MNQILLKNYMNLMRLDKPVGILLLLWPTLIALWLASSGKPSFKILIIFIAGVILMRSAGCIINDIVDKQFDGAVERTKTRPLASGKVTVSQALGLFFILLSLAFLLVLMLNFLTITLAGLGAIFAVIYPFLKRVTHLPQVGLGIAFAWGVPMAFAAELNWVPPQAWILFLAALIWAIIYDTYYAMVDKVDDVKVGIKSTAIFFGNKDRIIIGILQIIMLLLLIGVGKAFHLHAIYWISLVGVAALFAYQQWITRYRDRSACFKAFLNNQWVGAVLFLGVMGG
jgi:4-hydroxybenzoate polyprenyltransferase